MDKEHLIKIIKKGEGLNIEFKTSKNKLNRDVFDTVCAFLNRNGGHLFLGVRDNGEITGVDEAAIPELTTGFVSQCNNPQKLYPPYYLSPEVIDIDGKKIIYIFVPESSQVHNVAGKIFDRNEEGDFDVTRNHSHISQIYLRKQTTYTENKIFPYASPEDLDPVLIQRARIRARNENEGSHPWFDMDDLELLKSAQLYKKDFQSGKEGITLAGILLFGRDETILSVLPHHKTDAILRRKNLDRYDDRDDIRTNLLDSYDRLMGFIEKHLPDPFYLEKDIRISLRSKIFREAISNILIHREYSNAYPAKMIIESSRVVFENANKPRTFGYISPENFTPSPKNPVIARVFKEIGLADELGSGVRNIFKYTPVYSDGKQPELIEEDIFKIIIPVTAKVEGVNDKVEGVNDKIADAIENSIKKVIEEVITDTLKKSNKSTRTNLASLLNTIVENEGKRNPEYSELLNIPVKSIERYIQLLKEADLIQFIGNSPKTGGYYITEKLKRKLNS